MMDYLRVDQPGGAQLVALAGERLTIGQAESNDLAVRKDRAVSRLHAVLERFAAGWCLRDLGSRNGTYLNGERIFGERPLWAGDEIRVGRTRLAYRCDDVKTNATETETAKKAPALTPRESELLMVLCAPVLGGDLFTEPASIREMAETFVVTEAAIKQHLLRLYDKFAIFDDGTGRRRVRLANDAISRGAVSLADLGRQRRRAAEKE